MRRAHPHQPFYEDGERSPSASASVDTPADADAELARRLQAEEVESAALRKQQEAQLLQASEAYAYELHMAGGRRRGVGREPVHFRTALQYARFHSCPHWHCGPTFLHLSCILCESTQKRTESAFGH